MHRKNQTSDKSPWLPVKSLPCVSVEGTLDIERRRSGTRSLGYVPALDGLRAVAVLAVLAYHQNAQLVPGGWLGVSLFFTLSGFLIARVVIDEVAGTGRLSVRDFWVRRVRRLLPASLLALVMALVVARINDGAITATVAGDVRSALFYVTNWRFIFNDSVYANVEVAPSPVLHYWSLAIEEQFYIVFPLVMAVFVRRVRALSILLGLVVVVGLVQQLRLDDVDRIYFGTDTRAPELAVGVALAYAWPQLRTLTVSRQWLPDVAEFVGLSALGLLALGQRLDG